MADPHPTRFPHTPITLTVDEVREALNDRLDEALDGANATAIHAAIDALIAAVRAENAPLLAACRAALDWTPLREDRDILLNAIKKTPS